MFRNIDNLFLLSFRTQQQFYPVIGNQCNFKQRTTVLWFHNYVDQSTVYFQYDAKTSFCGRGKITSRLFKGFFLAAGWVYCFIPLILSLQTHNSNRKCTKYRHNWGGTDLNFKRPGW